MDDLLANDDDIRKIARLQLINASARFELLSANQQLIDFHLNRVMNTMFKKMDKQASKSDGAAADQVATSTEKGTQSSGVMKNPRMSNLMNIEKSVIHEVSETEENNTTQVKIGRHFGKSPPGISSSSKALLDAYADSSGKVKETEESIRDRNRDSMFGTMLLTSGMSKENEARMIQIQDPHQVM